MLKHRLIPVIILREGMVVQSVQFKHTNVIHSSPATAVGFFDGWAVDEIVVLDVSRDLSKREKFINALEVLSEKCFVPLTVGGWVDSLDEARKLLHAGGDKVAINTEAVRRPELIGEVATVFGNQCVVVSIDAKAHEDGSFEVYIDRAREPTGLEPAAWAAQAEEAGAGEILLNCIERDGNRQGYELTLLRSVAEAVTIPVVAMGGVSEWQHLVDGIYEGKADAVAAANIFHYTEHSTKKAKDHMRSAGIDVR